MRIDIEQRVGLFLDIEGFCRITDRSTMRARSPILRVNLLPGLANAACAVLVIGGADDPVTPIGEQPEIAAARPSRWVKFHAFANAGHGVRREWPEKTSALLKRFIAAPRQQFSSTGYLRDRSTGRIRSE